MFESEGPTPVVCIPDNMNESHQYLIAMKSISLLMGEQVYQEGKNFDLSYFGILPFPDIGLVSLTYFFLIQDESARGKAKASTISILVDEKQAQFLYGNMKQLSIMISDVSTAIDKKTNEKALEEKMWVLFDKINNFTRELKPSHTSSERTIKILFTGLDASGKTSFLRAIKKKYSALIGIHPTKGFKRSQQSILGRNLLEWDIGGQEKYRNKFIKDASIYLFDTNLLFFLVDIRNKKRFKEAGEFFKNILDRLRGLEQYPPIILCIHKMDPEIEDEEKYRKRAEKIREVFGKLADGFPIRFFETSIFNNYSLIKSFSAGITSMSPNREMFQAQLKWFAQKVNARSLLLINLQSIILGSFSVNKESGVVSEMAAPHFQNLYKTFEEFNLLRKNKAVWLMQDHFVYFYKLTVDENPLYLLCLTNGNKNEAKIEELLPDLEKKITPLLQTYL